MRLIDLIRGWFRRPPDPPAPPAGDVAADLLRLHNQSRARAGVAPLALDSRLSAAAAGYAAGLARRGVLTHGDTAARLAAAGWPAGRAWGENVAEGQPTAEGAVSAWLASPGHRRNLLSPAFRVVGFGAAIGAGGLIFWVADYGA